MIIQPQNFNRQASLFVLTPYPQCHSFPLSLFMDQDGCLIIASIWLPVFRMRSSAQVVRSEAQFLFFIKKKAKRGMNSIRAQIAASVSSVFAGLGQLRFGCKVFLKNLPQAIRNVCLFQTSRSVCIKFQFQGRLAALTFIKTCLI